MNVDLAELQEAICPCRHHAHPEPIDKVLRRRGLAIKRTGDWAKTLYPDIEHTGFQAEIDRRFPRYFGKGSFRSLLKQLATAQPKPVGLDALDSLAPKVLDEYLSFLVAAGLVELTSGGPCLTRTVKDIGSTFEWYVASVCTTELAGSAEWGVKLDDTPLKGDIDVLAWLEPTLVYIETKTSPPAAIKIGALWEFLQRSQILSAEVTILLLETESDITPVIDRLTDAMLPVLRKLDRKPDDWRPERPVIRRSDTFTGVHYGWPGIHITNSKPSVVTQIRRCLQHYHAKARGHDFSNGRPVGVNFLTGALHET